MATHSSILELLIQYFFHGYKNLLVIARLTFLNYTFLEFIHACIGTVLSIIDAGCIILTFFHNLIVPFIDPNLLKLQVKITGAKHISTTYPTTPLDLHSHSEILACSIHFYCQTRSSNHRRRTRKTYSSRMDNHL